MVSSDLSNGETADLDRRLRWRLDVLHKGAQVAIGQEQLRAAAAGETPLDPVRRLLSVRLSPVVAQMMQEAQPKESPRLGLRLSCACVEWQRSTAADAALGNLLAAALRVTASVATSTTAAALSWQGRLLAATQPWSRQLAPLDQAVILALAAEAGPAVFDCSSRTLALEEVELWFGCEGNAGTLHRAQSKSRAASGQYRVLNFRLECTAPDARDPTLVFTVLQSQTGTLTMKDLDRSAKLFGSSDQLWRDLVDQSALFSKEMLQGASGPFTAAVLMDEVTGDVATLPLPCGSESESTASALRQLLYWIDTLPPLSAERPQAFLNTHQYAISAQRRDDGLHCWVIRRPPGSEQPTGVLAAAELLQRAPPGHELPSFTCGKEFVVTGA